LAQAGMNRAFGAQDTVIILHRDNGGPEGVKISELLGGCCCGWSDRSG